MANPPLTKRAPTALMALLATGCAIHHVRDYAPSDATPQTADAATTSTNCFEASTTAERLACATPTLAAQNLTLTQTLQARLRTADIFARDALLAAQRAWLLTLPTACQLPSDPTAAPPLQATACLSQQYQAQTAALQSATLPQNPILSGANPLAQYVRFRPSPDAPPNNQGFCTTLAQSLNTAIAQGGTANPAAIPGATEIAGSHGPATATANGHQFAVELHEANAFGGFAQRASAVSMDGTQILTNTSLGQLLQATATNNGGRFSAYASQTGDYGTADIFQYQSQTLALLADAWGFNTPAAPGEFAHAGIWNIAQTPPTPLCLYDTFQMSAETGTFDTLPAFTQWRDLLTQIRDSTQPALGISTLRDQSQLRAETNWLLLHMPLVVTGQARAADWTPWLRHRHDDVLDALFAWSTKDPAHKPTFDKLFALIRPAAADLVHAYQQTQALTGDEAQQAAGLAVMELLYGATVNIAPGLGADLHAPSSAVGIKPRYPILAAPS